VIILLLDIDLILEIKIEQARSLINSHMIYDIICMEVHKYSPFIAKRLWNVLRITYMMIRKGVISKRKLMMDMNLMMKRGRLLRKSLSNLISNHHIHCSSKNAARGASASGIQEYEFSCSNSPAPVFFHVQPKRKQYHCYFPCINDPQPQVIEEADDDLELKAITALVPNTPPEIENSFNFRFDAFDFEIMKRSPLLSPFSVRVSNYSSEDDENEGGNWQVDEEAEEFIGRFYEQLRLQSCMQLRTAVSGDA